MDTPFDPSFDADDSAPTFEAEAPVEVRVSAFVGYHERETATEARDGREGPLMDDPAPAMDLERLAAAAQAAAAQASATPSGSLWNDQVTIAEELAEATPEGGRIAENDEVANLLSPFFQKGFLPRREARGLMDPVKRAEAERRLNGVGLTLAWSPYSRYYGLAMADGPGDRTERITNLQELDRNALALLVIMWARLVLPQRLAEEGREGGNSQPTVAFDALNAEYGKKLGGRRFEMYVSQLKRLGFLEYTRKDEIKAGPFLDLLGDSHKLASYLRQSTLAKVLADVPARGERDEAEADDAVAVEA